jgi:tetratricopeptide (TPR) repeat protein
MTKKKKQEPRDARRLFDARQARRMERALLAAIGIGFIYHCIHFQFVQDDSFITFRYVENLIQGNGLVFNPGERVEGYTTFLWTILLAVPAFLRIDLIAASHVLGVAAGLASLYIMYRLRHTISRSDAPWGSALIAAGLTAANSSLVYWTSSGMETPLFMFLLVLSVWLYLTELQGTGPFTLAPLAFVLLSLTRPEGMLFFGLTLLHFTWRLVRAPDRAAGIRRGARLALVYAVPILLFTGWRLAYYGYLFPNTYYAKAGFSQAYLQAGTEYFLFFARTYLFQGLLLLIPVALLLWRRRTPQILYLLLLLLGYTLYVVSVGGDVLHAFRFFVPVLPLIYLVVQEALVEIVGLIRTAGPLVRALPIGIAILLGYMSFTNAYGYVREKWMLELGLVEKMTQTGEWLKGHASPGKAVAASTIGAVAYYSGVPLIDMLGLTDATIAHSPEYVEGIQSGWKERKYNNTYLLSREPEWIFFSTGVKPSAYAERALFAKAEFRRSYYPCFFHLNGDMNSLNIAYKRSPVPLVDTSRYSATIKSMDFINNFYDGMNRRRTPSDALKYYLRALESAPEDFALLYQELGGVYRSQNNRSAAEEAYRHAVAINPAMIESQLMLGMMARERNDQAAAQEHFAQVVRFNPEYSLGWTLLAENSVMRGDTTGARPSLERALQLSPNNTDAYNYLMHITRR